MKWLLWMKSFLTTRVGRRFLQMFIFVWLTIAVAGWFGIQSITLTLKRQNDLILRVASNGAEAQLREFLLRIKDETLASSADERVRKALEEASQGDSHTASQVLASLRERIPEARQIFVLGPEGRVAASSAPLRQAMK